jgi:S-DNA-T family DNA segregation ATPase FtsK/SpoIIIE
VKKPEQLETYLCDFEKSEFHLFRNIKHVKKYARTIHELMTLLSKISEEMKSRGDSSPVGKRPIHVSILK